MAFDPKGALFALVLAVPALAADVGGAQLAEHAQVGTTQLTLNGAGIRKRVFFDVYAIGLYLPRRAQSAREAIAPAPAKRVMIQMLRDVSAEQFSAALADAIRDNHSEAEAQALEPDVRSLTAIMNELKEAKKGMRLALDWTGQGTQLVVDGKPVGKAIGGEGFYQGLLRIWLGDRPVQDDLKKSLLGSS